MNEQAIAVLLPIGLLLWHLFGVGASYLSDKLSQSQPDNQQTQKNNEWAQLLDVINKSVQGTEQEQIAAQKMGHKPLDGDNKKSVTLRAVELFCNEFKMEFKPDVASKLIDQAVYIMNQNKTVQTDLQPTRIDLPAIK